MKKCTKCGGFKSFEEFSKSNQYKDGLKYHCKKCISDYMTKYYSENIEVAKIQRKHWYKNNRDIAILRSNKRAKDNRERHNKASCLWAKNNPDKVNARTAKRNAAKLQRIPKWLTKSDWIEIKWAYKIAKQMSKETSIPHEVDHIVPLQGKSISGLHCP
jgi:hypothetical protein